MPGQVGIAHQRAHVEAAAFGDAHLAQRQVRDVDQPRRPGDAFLHEVEQIGAAGDEARAVHAANGAQRIGRIGGAVVLERIHRTAFHAPDC